VKPRVLDLHAAIDHDVHACGVGPCNRIVVNDTVLKPNRFDPRGKRIVNNTGKFARPPEDIDDIRRAVFGCVCRKRWVGSYTVDRVKRWIDGRYFIFGLTAEVGEDRVARAQRIARCADYRDRPNSVKQRTALGRRR
jgi:hypothetical protein